MTFSKFFSLLWTRSLHFARADTFQDPYEGHWTHFTAYDFRRKPLTRGARMLLDQPAKRRREMYISCWCAGKHESAALWSLYVPSGEGVAITTTAGLLADQLEASPLQIHRSSVTYADYAVTQMPWREGPFNLFTHKRISFAHESEFRAIIWGKSAHNRSQVRGSPTSVSVPIEPSLLIKNVHVAPTSPAWLQALVQEVCHQAGLSLWVRKSELALFPVTGDA